MKPSWCASLPVLSVPQSDHPKPVTLILPFYQNHQFLRRQIGWWSTYPEHVKAHLNAIIVDDGSPEPAAQVLEAVAHPFPIRLFRISVDVRWNWLAARNIGFHHASDGWCLVTDMDHVLPASTAEALVYGKHDLDKSYAFARIEHSGEKVTPHSASFFMTRQLFWTVGGYDERYSGHYGSDGKYRKRLLAAAPMQVLPDRLVRHEYDGDSSTTAYTRKEVTDNSAIARIAASIPAWTAPRVLSFPYHEVALKVAVA